MGRGGQRGYGNAGRSAYSGGTRGGQSRAVFMAPGGAGSGPPTLGTLGLSGTLQIGTATSGTISGATAGSTIAGNIPGITVNSGARTYAGTPTGSAATIANGLVETLAGATGSPKSSAITVAAAAASPTLATLTLASTAATAGASGSTAVQNKTSGSAITLTSNPSGVFSYAEPGGVPTLSWTNAITAGTLGPQLTETLAGAVGSPKVTDLTVTASGEEPAFTALSPFAASQPVSAIYSMRKVNPAYNGASLRIRNSAATVLDVGWVTDPAGSGFQVIDMAAITAHAALGNGTFNIVYWCDQSGNARHAGPGGTVSNLKAATVSTALGASLPTFDFDGSATSGSFSTTNGGGAAWLNTGGTYNFSAFVNAELFGGNTATTGACPRTYPHSPTYAAQLLSAGSALPLMTACQAGTAQLVALDTQTATKRDIHAIDFPEPRKYPLGAGIATPPAIQVTGSRVANVWSNQKGASLSGGGDGKISFADRAHGTAASTATALIIGALGSNRPANSRVREIIIFNNAGALSDLECQRIDLWQTQFWGSPQTIRIPKRLAIMHLGESTAAELGQESSNEAALLLGDTAWARIVIPELMSHLGRSYASTDIVYRDMVAVGGKAGAYCLTKPSTPEPPNGTWAGQSSGLAFQKFYWDQRYNIPGPLYHEWKKAALDTAFGASPATMYADWAMFITQGINDIDIAETQANGITFANWKAAWKSIIMLARTDVGAGDFPVFFHMAKRPTAQPSKEMRMRDIYEEICAELPNCFMLPEGGLISLRGDGTHYQTGPGIDVPNNAAPAYGPEGDDRLAHWIARGMAAKLGAPNTIWKGPELSPTFVRSGPAVLDFTVNYPAGCGGTDFSPASGIFGFTVYDGGVAQTIASAVRLNASTIRVTTSAALSGTVTADYRPNLAEATSAGPTTDVEGGRRVRDNTMVGTTGMPMRQRKGMVQAA